MDTLTPSTFATDHATYGVLMSCANDASMGPDLIYAFHTSASHAETAARAERMDTPTGVRALVVARLSSGAWVTENGRSPVDVIRDLEATGHWGP